MNKRRRVVVIYNPNAGAGRFKVDGTTILSEFKKYSKAMGVELELELKSTSSKGDCEDLSGESCRTGADIVAIAGGDGTIMEAVNSLIGSPSALGIVPIGSGNDTITSISGHADRERCIREIISKDPVSIDVGNMNGTFFLNVIGIGLDAEINHYVSHHRDMVRRVGPALTYTYGALRTLLRFEPYNIRTTIDGKGTSEHVISLCTIGNGTTCGGGYKLTPKAVMNDGSLDLSISRYLGRIRSILNIRTAYEGKHIELPGNIYRRFESLNIEGMDKELPFHMDGEGGFSRKMSINVLPGALRIVHPISGGHFR